MSVYPPTPRVQFRNAATMMPYKPPAPPPPAPPPQIANPPAGPSLTQASAGAIAVTWSAPAVDSTHDAATGFNLRFSPSGTNFWTVVPGVKSPYVLAGQTVGSPVDIEIQSTNAAGTSAWSAASTFPAVTLAPNTPVGVSLAQSAGGGLTVTWTPPAVDSTHGAAAGYNVQSSPSGAGTWTIVSRVSSPFTVTGLAAGAAFDVQVQSSNAAGASAWSAIDTFTMMTAAPNVPVGVSLAQGAGSNLTVTWIAPATDSTHNAATEFNLQSSPSGANTWTTITGVSSPYTLSGLAAGAAIDVEVQGSNAAGASAWSATSTLITASGGPYPPNAAVIAGVAPPADGTTAKLTITWTAPAVDGTHSAAIGYNLRTSPSGANTWTIVTGVTSPYTLTGLAGATSIDVEIQATNAAVNPSAWSAISTGKTWGATVAPGNWVAAASQVHGTSVAPNGGAQMIAVAAPTAVTAGAFGWSTGQTTPPTSGLIAAPSDGQSNGWGQYFNAPATAGTYYLWMLAQGSGGVTIGALVTSAITVT